MRIGTLDRLLTGNWDNVSWDTIYPLAGELGFEGLELGVWTHYGESQLWTRAARRQLLRLTQQTGVVTALVCLHAYWDYSFADPEAAIRKRVRRIAEEAAQYAAELGAKCLLIPLTCPKGGAEDQARERWVEGMRSCAPAAETAGVFFCLENVACSFADRLPDVAAIVDAIASPAVRVFYDPGNALDSSQDPLQGLELLGQRIAQVHVKERRGTYFGQAGSLGPGSSPASRRSDPTAG